MYIEYNQNYHCPGKNIQLLRKQYAMSRRTLAVLLAIDEAFLTEIETGQNPPILDGTLYCRLMQIFPIPEGKDIFSPDLFH